MKIPNKILDCVVEMDVQDDDSIESDFAIGNDIKCNISNIISSLGEESADSQDEIQLIVNTDHDTSLKLADNKTENNNSKEFLRPVKLRRKLKVNRSKPLKTNGHIHKFSKLLLHPQRPVLLKSRRSKQKLVSSNTKVSKKSSHLITETIQVFQEVSLADQKSLQNFQNCTIKVQNCKPFIGNKSYYESIVIKSLKKRIENHDMYSTPPKPSVKKLKKVAVAEQLKAHIELVKVRDIVNFDPINPPSLAESAEENAENVMLTPKLNSSLAPLKSILSSSRSATPNSTSSLKTPKKVTFCSVIFVKNIEVDYEAEYGPSEYDSFDDDDDDSDDEDFAP